MPAAKRRRLGRLVGLVVVLAAALTAPFWGPPLGSRIPWLEVDRVEVTGVSLAAPHDILRASGIHPGRHLFDDLSLVKANLQRHPVVAGVQITRAFPNRLVLQIEEKEPIALLGSAELLPVTSRGELLPVDPTGLRLDLPIVSGSLDDPDRAPETRRLLAEAGRLADMDPALLGEVSEISYLGAEKGVLLLVHDDGEILLPFGATVARLEQLRAVLTDVRGRRAVGPEGAAPSPVVDLRYDDQIVVRNLTTHDLS